MEFIYTILASYALTFIITAASILDKPRTWLMSKTPMLIVRNRHMLECRMCTGFWASILICLIYNDVHNILAVYGASYFLATQERG